MVSIVGNMSVWYSGTAWYQKRYERNVKTESNRQNTVQKYWKLNNDVQGLKYKKNY